jgi:hypothetical protein
MEIRTPEEYAEAKEEYERLWNDPKLSSADFDRMADLGDALVEWEDAHEED